MKLIVTTALLGVTDASMSSLFANIESVNVTRNYDPNLRRGPGRAFKGSIANAFELINGYGCWCYLDDTWRDANQVLFNRPAILAHGQVVDASCREE